MVDPTTTITTVNAGSDALVKAAAAVQQASVSLNGSVIHLFGYNLNIATLLIVVVLAALGYLFWTIQHSQRLDFADMITKDGRKVSGTKVAQLVAIISSTWVVIQQGINGTLSAEIFGLYLVYAASIEGFAKFMAAKYGYNETSLRDAQPGDTVTDRPIETNVKTVLGPDGDVKSVEQNIKRG